MKYWVLHKKRLNRKPGAVSKLRKAARARRRAEAKADLSRMATCWVSAQLVRLERDMFYGESTDREQETP